MQTFLPEADFELSVRALDSRRLIKQVLETQQIITIIENKKGAWSRHPACLMWADHVPCLALYGLTAAKEYTRRYGKIHACVANIKPYGKNSATYPWWFGDIRLHRSHRANLLRKDRLYYRQYRKTCRPDEPYWWPVKLVEGRITYIE
jgi:hypothetical protein